MFPSRPGSHRTGTDTQDPLGRGQRVKILKEICRAQGAMTGDKVRRVRGQVNLRVQYGKKPPEEQQGECNCFTTT